jgi:hypothetical protein
MSLQLQIENAPGYLAARFIGAGTAKDAWSRFDFIAEQCHLANTKKVLLDFTAYQVKVTIADLYGFGVHAQVFNRYGVKIAVALTDEQYDPRGFSERVGRNRGIDVQIFIGVRAAEEWLLKDAPHGELP